MWARDSWKWEEEEEEEEECFHVSSFRLTREYYFPLPPPSLWKRRKRCLHLFCILFTAAFVVSYKGLASCYCCCCRCCSSRRRRRWWAELSLIICVRSFVPFPPSSSNNDDAVGTVSFFRVQEKKGKKTRQDGVIDCIDSGHIREEKAEEELSNQSR